ncbi:Wzb Protein-tyrosine-phosphatase [Methylophilaceae bacterium]
MADKIYNILVLCTGNSARSIMAEALFNKLGKGRFKAYSAGSHPTGKVHPMAIEVVNSLGYPSSELRSKSWDEFALPDAPQMDFIFTVCDKAAGEACPVWLGKPITAHWGFDDPAAFQGTDEEKRQEFQKILRFMSNRVNLFTNLPLASLDNFTIKNELDNIGKIKDQ